MKFTISGSWLLLTFYSARSASDGLKSPWSILDSFIHLALSFSSCVASYGSSALKNGKM